MSSRQDHSIPNRQFLINRILIVLAVAAILTGLFLDQWRIVLQNALLL
jgi:hypothetical protein